MGTQLIYGQPHGGVPVPCGRSPDRFFFIFNNFFVVFRFWKFFVREILERENFLTKNFGDQKKFQAKKGEQKKNSRKKLESRKNSRIFFVSLKIYSSEKIKEIQKKIVEIFLQKKTRSGAAVAGGERRPCRASGVPPTAPPPYVLLLRWVAARVPAPSAAAASPRRREGPG